MYGIIAALIGAAGFGTANVVIKKSLSNLSIPQTLTMSTLSGALCMGIYALVSNAQETITLELLGLTAVMAVLEVILYLILYKALEVSNVTIAMSITSTHPILVTIFAVIFLSQSINIFQGLSIIFIVIGSILVSVNWIEVMRKGFGSQNVVAGLPWIIATLLIHAVYFPILGEVTATGSWQIKLLLIKIFSAIIMFVIFYIVRREKVMPPKSLIPFTSLLGLLEVIGWAGLSWGSSNTDIETSILIAIVQTAPALFTALLAYIFLKEKLTPIQYFGMAVIIFCIAVISMNS
jgi:drug/metabolite transporter (DMT)-like permease